MKFGDYKLRYMAETDLLQVLQWRNSDRVRPNMFNDKLITLEEHREWHQRIKYDSTVKYFIFEYKNNPIGVINISDLNSHSNECTWGFYIGETLVPRGSGTVMGYLALEYTFALEGIGKVVGHVLALNPASIRFHTRLGFVEIGKLTARAFKKGKYEDVIVMSLLNEEWKRVKQNIKNHLPQ